MTEQKDVSFIVFESTMARFERTISRLWVALIVVIFLLVATNLAWIGYEQQFEDVVTTIDAQQDGSGVNMIGGGDVSYGAESQNNN